MKKPILLEVTPACIVQKDPATKKVLTSYNYKDIDYLGLVSDLPNGFVLANHGFARLHMFQCEERDRLTNCALEYAGNYVGISLKHNKEPITYDQFWNEKFGTFG